MGGKIDTTALPGETRIKQMIRINTAIRQKNKKEITNNSSVVGSWIQRPRFSSLDNIPCGYDAEGNTNEECHCPQHDTHYND